jgi:3-methylcrotonyl-CoA carboxylase alpha subunit
MKRVLIANRGEIACRIIRTCKRLNIETVAIASEADLYAKHVREADYAVIIGPAIAKESYLNIEKIVEVAKSYHVDAVHPGYGFLSENPEFAEALAGAGIIFIGPSIQAIQAMGSKSEAKAIAEKVGVPIIPGYRGAEQEEAQLHQQAQRIGFPLLIKATYGGGGKGMRRVDTLDAFSTALASCQREALAAFGNAEVMLEKYLDKPRHIEVQVFGDQHGQVVALAERDCSLQRRHQKIIEEAPGFNLSGDLKAKLAQAAIKIAQEVSYVGAGTVEFLVDAQENFYFLEMNTRLQVEHPVTEMILGVDLVEWQIRVAQGESLPLNASELHPKGHAIEVRLYAEDPENQFLPSTGRIEQFVLPEHAQVRLDAGVDMGDSVSVFYDPMIAKVIVWGENRQRTLKTLRETLDHTQIQGVKTNLTFLKQLLSMPEVTSDWIDVGFIDRLTANPENEPIPLEAVALLALWLRLQWSSVGGTPWDLSDGWRHCGLRETKFEMVHASQTYSVVLAKDKEQWQVCVNDHFRHYTVLCCDEHELVVRCYHEIVRLKCHRQADQVSLIFRDKFYQVRFFDQKHLHDFDTNAQSNLSAPMPGRVISVIASAGQEVDMGAPLLILEAMKMEHTIRAPYKGTVEQIFFNSGDFVEEGMELAKVRAA